MSNALNRLIDLLPKTPEFIGTVQTANHPEYKVLVVDGTGLVICTATAKYFVGQRVFIAGTEIKREAPSGTVLQIEV